MCNAIPPDKASSIHRPNDVDAWLAITLSYFIFPTELIWKKIFKIQNPIPIHSSCLQFRSTRQSSSSSSHHPLKTMTPSHAINPPILSNSPSSCSLSLSLGIKLVVASDFLGSGRRCSSHSVSRIHMVSEKMLRAYSYRLLWWRIV